mmetsp:Transcript_41765/g.135095  ORF Transcript_41765/g.135095 Transcript_41765/m.135095 type:complete len:272 (-) Transcript_41765:243-1058(-)
MLRLQVRSTEGQHQECSDVHSFRRICHRSREWFVLFHGGHQRVQDRSRGRAYQADSAWLCSLMAAIERAGANGLELLAAELVAEARADVEGVGGGLEGVRVGGPGRAQRARAAHASAAAAGACRGPADEGEAPVLGLLLGARTPGLTSSSCRQWSPCCGAQARWRDTSGGAQAGCGCAFCRGRGRGCCGASALPSAIGSASSAGGAAPDVAMAVAMPVAVAESSPDATPPPRKRKAEVVSGATGTQDFDPSPAEKQARTAGGNLNLAPAEK